MQTFKCLDKGTRLHQEYGEGYMDKCDREREGSEHLGETAMLEEKEWIEGWQELQSPLGVCHSDLGELQRWRELGY